MPVKLHQRVTETSKEEWKNLAKRWKMPMGEAIDSVVEDEMMIALVDPLPIDPGVRTAQLHVEMEEKNLVALEREATKLGVSVADVLIFLGRTMTAAVETAERMKKETVPAGVARKASETAARDSVRLRPVEVLIESPIGSGILWPGQPEWREFDWKPGDSYWTQDELGLPVYVWSGNLGNCEYRDMIRFMLTPSFGNAANPASGLGNYPSREAYEAHKDDMMMFLEGYADLWITCLRAIAEANAEERALWPTTGTDNESPIQDAQAFLHYLQKHPGLLVSDWKKVASDCGLDEGRFVAVRDNLTFELTSERDVFTGTWPWRMMSAGR